VVADSLKLYEGNMERGIVKASQVTNARSGRSIGVRVKKYRWLTAHQRSSSTIRRMNPFRSTNRRSLNGREKV
jgi:hypothetical protein